MPIVTFIQADGTSREVNILPRSSAMSGAVQSGVQGILAECGGSCACATCHVYVDESCIDLLPAMESLEDDLLEAVASERRPTSRLSCQIKLTAELDGKLILHIPEHQV
jgi:2Fe-2S ferredoxin